MSVISRFVPTDSKFGCEGFSGFTVNNWLYNTSFMLWISTGNSSWNGLWL